jgi:MFS family permease
MNTKLSSRLVTSPWRKDLVILYTVALLAGIAVGLFNPVISLKMKEAGFSDIVIGIASSLFFLGVIVVAPMAGYVARRYSLRAVLAIGLAVAGIGSTLFPMAQSLEHWILFRLVLAVGIGFYLIGGQSAVNTLAPKENRSLISGLYALSFGFGMGAGPMGGAALFSVDSKWAFYTCALILWLGVPMVMLGLQSETSKKLIPLERSQIRQMSVPLHAVFAYGVAESIFMSLFPIALVDRGLTVTEMSIAFSIFVLGGLISTLPITRLADIYGQGRVLATCAATGTLGSLAMAWSNSAAATMAASILTGAALGPIFALALAIVGSLLPTEQLPAGSALFTIAFSIGSMIAPFFAALLISEWGSEHIFTLSSILFASLLIRILVNRPMPFNVPTGSHDLHETFAANGTAANGKAKQ